MTGATFGYAAGWNPYASDYTRYLPTGDASRRKVGLYAGLGVFLSCVLLELAGTAVVTAGGNDVAPGQFTGLLPTWLGKLALLCICLGAIAANAINIYSGSLSCMAMGIRLPTHLARASVSVVFAIAGFFVALSGLHDAGRQLRELPADHLVLDRPLARRRVRRPLAAPRHVGRCRDRRFRSAGLGGAGRCDPDVHRDRAVHLAVRQPDRTTSASCPKHVHQYGDLTFEAGFVIAAVLYYLLVKLARSRPALDGAIVK